MLIEQVHLLIKRYTLCCLMLIVCFYVVLPVPVEHHNVLVVCFSPVHTPAQVLSLSTLFLWLHP